MRLEASCHCGRIKISLEQANKQMTSCNCSVCRRYAPLWIYGQKQFAELTAKPKDIHIYQCGDRMINFCFCRHCASLTHYSANPERQDYKEDATERFALNGRMCEPLVIKDFEQRLFDGADSWQYI
ncbi:hypothetical protein DBZ36_01495 [Alginatibacterium sediminis]|uniref:CENP-V/GFA domain-containing protein n=1 Tax=Alginatibacterium sediminis TaxID=2164068 RepID=A0A420EL75_9ALTE|nr:hypothetical protein [Alginatibacterium sediminis]RKF21354.1 hypothetical protein DBZ36_01495 [Alginatibacterium sediminis]